MKLSKEYDVTLVTQTSLDKLSWLIKVSYLTIFCNFLKYVLFGSKLEMYFFDTDCIIFTVALLTVIFRQHFLPSIMLQMENAEGKIRVMVFLFKS